MLDLTALFDEYEHVLLVSSAVARFSILKRRVLECEGYIRVRAELTDGGLLEFSEFWSGTLEDDIVLCEYTYHWQNAEGRLIQRWDTAKHHRDLPYAPHHIHLGTGTTEGNPYPPTLQSVLREIESIVS
jgi:hypothetical protein